MHENLIKKYIFNQVLAHIQFPNIEKQTRIKIVSTQTKIKKNILVDYVAGVQ